MEEGWGGRRVCEHVEREKEGWWKKEEEGSWGNSVDQET